MVTGDILMSKWNKLLEKISSLSKDMRFNELCIVLESYGYEMYQPRGGSSHCTFRKDGCRLVTISAASLPVLAKWGSCRWTSTRSCSTGLWITQWSIRMAGWCSLSATEWRLARRFKESSGRVSGIFGYPARCFCVWKFVKN